MSDDRDKALALMVYETWLLNGATSEAMPSLRLRKWCNRQVKRALFPVTKQGERARRRRRGDE